MENQKNTDNHTKFSIPLGDCLKVEYNKKGEVIGFLLRPRIAEIMHSKDHEEGGIKNISQLLKIVTYLNRMMTQGTDL